MSDELKLVLDGYARRARGTFTVEQAIDYLIDYNYGEHEGVAEAGNRKASKAGEYLAKLIAKMHAKGLLTTEEVIELLDEHFKVATE